MKLFDEFSSKFDRDIYSKLEKLMSKITNHNNNYMIGYEIIEKNSQYDSVALGPRVYQN